MLGLYVKRFFFYGCLGILMASSCLVEKGLASSESHMNGTAMPSKIVTFHLIDYRNGLNKLIAEGFDIAGVDITNGTVDIITNQEGLGGLKSSGLGEVVKTRDLEPELAPDGRYTTYAEMVTSLQTYAERFPNIVRLESIGKSHEGRDIWAIKISDNVSLREDEPSIFFNAMHHAREVMTTEVALDIIEQLTSRYETDSSVKRWVDGNEIWVVPMVNPDGNHKVWTSNSMWRKNTREGYGVDINRNYPYAWGSCGGSSGSTYSDTYRGPSAGSEPETQAVMSLVARVQPVISVSYHSYSEIVIYPYGCDGERAEEREVVEGLGKQLADKLVKDSGSGRYEAGTSWELLYSVDGGDIDWYYNTHHVLPYVIEVNSGNQGFQPPYTWRQSTVERMRPGWALLLDRLEQSGIRGVVTSAGRRSSEGFILVTPITAGVNVFSETRTYRVKNDGTFHVVLEPGMYKVTFQNGDALIEENVTVGSTVREVNFNVE